LFRVNGGKLAEFIEDWNKLPMWEQLGSPVEECLTGGKPDADRHFAIYARRPIAAHFPQETTNDLTVLPDAGRRHDDRRRY
jgi:hypothetical protein